MKNIKYVVMARVIFLATFLFSCNPKLQRFLIINQNINKKEHTFLHDERRISYKISAGYRIHYRQISVIAKIEFKKL